MKSRIFLLPALLAFLFMIFCSEKDQPTAPQKTLSQEEALAIETTHEQISEIGKNCLIADDPIAEFEDHLLNIQSQAHVQSAWVTGDGLFVRYKNGGIVSWLVTSKDIKPPYLPKNLPSESNFRPRTGQANTVGNNKVCLMNQQFNDESRPYCREIINRLEHIFTKNGFDVDQINGNSLDLDFFDSEQSEYGTLFLITHGMNDGTRTWICTGQEGEIDLFTRIWYWDWFNNQIALAYVVEVRNGVETMIGYVSLSDLFIVDEYDVDDFPNSLIYSVACQFLKASNFADALIAAGAGAVIGWDETNCRGQRIGEHLMNTMLGGSTLEDAYEAVPEEDRVDYCAVEEGARLTYLPADAGDFMLVEPATPPELIIASPSDGQVLTNRILQLEGEVVGANQIQYGIVQVNQIATTLEFTGLDISQPVVIKQGDNSIRIQCLTELENGKTAGVSKELVVHGNFPLLDLFTELRWNTDESDVDLHLLPPGAESDDLFSRADCFYDNMNPSWGAVLDVDDVEGYGPEHIEIPQARQSGTYRLFVHFYDDDGQVARGNKTQAFVDVSAKEGTLFKFGPYDLQNSLNGYNSNGSSGDLVEVCTVDFPSGTVTPVNRYHYFTLTGMQTIPHKVQDD